MDVCYARALSGFLMVLSDGGDMIFLSENVSRLLGLGQVSVRGQLCNGGGGEGGEGEGEGCRARGGEGGKGGLRNGGLCKGEGVNVRKGATCEGARRACVRVSVQGVLVQGVIV